MSEYWKSTPSYWCKFCSTYVKDTGLERKNHEASGKHQNNIQRSLRELHKSKERESRDSQRAKDEVARLNGVVGGTAIPGRPIGSTGLGPVTNGTNNGVRAPTPVLSQQSAAVQRKAHAEQLVALGVELPEELKREVTGIGGWQTISERVIESPHGGGRSLADIKKEEEESKEDVKGALSRGVHKRVTEGEDDETTPKRKAWGSNTKAYPGGSVGQATGDLEALLSGITKKRTAAEDETEKTMKKEEAAEKNEPLADVPDISTPTLAVKQEEGETAPPVVFKKRKVKR